MLTPLVVLQSDVWIHSFQMISLWLVRTAVWAASTLRKQMTPLWWCCNENQHWKCRFCLKFIPEFVRLHPWCSKVTFQGLCGYFLFTFWMLACRIFHLSWFIWNGVFTQAMKSHVSTPYFLLLFWIHFSYCIPFFSH